MKSKFFLVILSSLALLISCSRTSNVVPSKINPTNPHSQFRANGADGVARAWKKSKDCLRGYGNCAIAVSGGGDETYKTPHVSVLVTDLGQLQMIYRSYVDTEEETSLVIGEDEEFFVEDAIAQ